MHIVVCVKLVPDWDIPPSDFKVDEDLKQASPNPGKAALASQFDVIGVEAAMLLKEEAPDTKVTIMSMGPARVRGENENGRGVCEDEGVMVNDTLLKDLDWYKG